MKRRSFCAAAAASVLPAAHAWAAGEFPNRPVRMICAFAPGGGPDVFLRRVMLPFGEALGQPVVVENKVGAAGVLAAQYVAAQPADGYCLVQGAISHVLQKLMTPGLQFDPLRDFAPVTNMASSGSILVVPAQSPYRSVHDLIAAAKAAPGKLNYASGGIGTPAHLLGAVLTSLSDTKVVHIPLRGSVEIMPSLLRGDTQFAFPIAGTALPLVRGGKLRALAISSSRRIQQLPDVPTLEEVLKSKLAVLETWTGIWAPAGTPGHVVDRLYQAATVALRSPSASEAFEGDGSEPAPSGNPADYARFMRDETRKLAEVVRLAGVSAS